MWNGANTHRDTRVSGGACLGQRRRVSRRSPSPQLRSSVRLVFCFISIVISIISSYVASRRCRAAASHAARHRLSCSRARSS